MNASALRPSAIFWLSSRSPGAIRGPQFKTAEFKEGVEKIADLRPDMTLEGVVTNVTAFGAFVDVGVHQDGLVHVSELADRFVKDPRDVVKAGDVVKVRVKNVDVERKRIALTMRSGAIETQSAGRVREPAAGRAPFAASSQRSNAMPSNTNSSDGESALAAALRRAREAGKG